jgi:hypothetical protein
LQRSEPPNEKRITVESDAIFRFKQPVVFHGHIPQNQYTDKKEFLQQITLVAHNAILEMISKYNIYDYAYNQTAIVTHEEILYQLKSTHEKWFWLEEEGGRANLHIMKGFEFLTHCNIWFHPSLQYTLGFTEYVTHDVGWISFEHSTVWRNAVSPIDLTRNTFKSLWVYCNIIQPSFIGSNVQPLLRLLPVKSDTNVISYEVLTNLQYHRIVQNAVQTIRIWFTEEYDGKPLKMYADSYIRLHLKRDQ